MGRTTGLGQGEDVKEREAEELFLLVTNGTVPPGSLSVSSIE